MNATRQKPDLIEFWLGFAFGAFGIAAFLVGAWARGSLTWLVP